MNSSSKTPFSVTYTTRARRISLRYPYLTTIWTQVNFWTVAYILMALTVYFGANGVVRNMGKTIDLHIAPPLIVALFMGVSYGFMIGTIYYFLEKKIFKNKPIWTVIIYQALISLVLLSFLTLFTQFFIFQRLAGYFLGERVEFDINQGWTYFVSLVTGYTMVMTLLISFINQMNKKFGPGVLIPMLLGRYRTPREDKRIFMFLDLTNSTGLAEELGHLEYSSLVRDFFQDINNVVQRHDAEIYQYVGDEIVLSWDLDNGLKDSNVLEFFFSCKTEFQLRSSYYLKRYKVVPEFKAGVHLGMVTVVEVGDIKRDIAYHGDTLNVASRIEHLCKELKQDILISGDLHEALVLDQKSKFNFKYFGDKNLKGRSIELGVYGVK